MESDNYISFCDTSFMILDMIYRSGCRQGKYNELVLFSLEGEVCFEGKVSF
jgi:hypothetical protein